MDNLLNHELQNKRIQASITKAIVEYFPIIANKKQLDIRNIKIKDTLDSNDFPSQKAAKLGRKS